MGFGFIQVFKLLLGMVMFNFEFFKILFEVKVGIGYVVSMSCSLNLMVISFVVMVNDFRFGYGSTLKNSFTREHC